MIHTIHLLHHTHTDFGYTDHPTIAMRLFDRYTSEALQLIERHQGRSDDASRFRWNIEVAEVALRFWQRASEPTRQQMQRFAAEGLLDVGAMPFHPHGFTGSAEWEAIERRLTPVRANFRPRTAVINDINGLAWGIIPRLLDSGVSYLSSGLNLAGGRAPRGLPRPGLFKWQGPDDRWIWVWNGLHYCDGYFFFHDQEWRKGPIPAVHDPFYHPPLQGDTWHTDAENLESARTILQNQLSKLASYPHDHLGLQVTNMWRMDNDPPCELLCDFVAAWNAAGFLPRLRISTFTHFLDAVTAEPTAANAPLVRGDWTNFWADGVAALPRENDVVDRAVRILRDLPALAEVLQAPLRPNNEVIEQAWHDVSMFSEHTSDAHDSVSDASGDLSQGCKAFKASRAYEALAGAQLALSDLVRASPLYTPGRHATGVTVVNPSARDCSDWIELPIPALPDGKLTLVDETTGQAVPTEVVRESVWSEPRSDDAAPFDRPHNTFGAAARNLRAFVQGVPARGQRTFSYSVIAALSAREDRGWTWEWDASRKQLSRLAFCEGMNWIAPIPPGGLGMGGLFFDTYPELGARWALTLRDRTNPPASARRVRSIPTMERFSLQACPGFDEARLLLQHPHCHRIEQRWLRHHLLPRIEIETTLWLKEITEPVIGAVAFPFAAEPSEMWYTSLGHPTRVGRDQMPGACGAYTLTEAAVGVVGAESLILAAPGSPLMAFGELDIFSDRTPAAPQHAHVFSIFACTRWVTNFPHLRPIKLHLRHRIDAASADAAREPSGETSLYVVPCTG